MKKAIAWAVCRKRWSSDLRVIAVTTRKPNGRVYGRTDDLTAVNVAAQDVRGFYDSVEAARAALTKAEQAHAGYIDRIAEADGWVRSLRVEQERAVTLALNVPGRIP